MPTAPSTGSTSTRRRPGTTITPVAGATVPLGAQMILDGNRLVVPDENGVTVVELGDDADARTVVRGCATPRSATRPPRRGSATATSWSTPAWNRPPPYTISSVPVVP